MKKYLPLSFFLMALLACNAYRDLPDINYSNDWKTKSIGETPILSTGDPEKGWEYLITGDYIGSGIPYEFLRKRIGDFKDTLLKRENENAQLPFEYIAFQHANGAKVVSGNCLTCHATYLNGTFIPGLGDIREDFTRNDAFQLKAMAFLVNRKFKKDSPERLAFETFKTTNKASLPNIRTPMVGVNPAFRLEEGYAMVRNPVDLTIQETANFEMSDYVLASDTPPWWHLKKRKTLYYNGMGRGDFSKLLMQASTQGIKDSAQARVIQKKFVDVVAYLASLEAPPYPFEIDQKLAQKGAKVFERNCSKCHGMYGEKESYPNKLVSLEIVKTDPYYARYFTTQSHLADWYNKSWYAQSMPLSSLQPEDGYVAPPLDGVWATAPYLHNGAIPTIEALLNSKLRPTYWSIKKTNFPYDENRLGWLYDMAEKPKGKKDKWVYNTQLPGYSNQGHLFGDNLSRDQRKAVIEYLKTL